MSRNSSSTTTTEQTRPWLKAYYQARRQQTVELVKATVDRLLREERAVTLEAVCALSREVDPQGKGIKKAGILGNAEAHAYYRQHSVTYQRRARQRRRGHKTTLSMQPSRIDPNRDVQRVRQRYLLQHKEDLVDRLLSVEQELGKTQQQLASLQFEVLALQQQVEHTE